MKERKDVVRVVRIPKKLDDILRGDAEANGTTVSAVISGALTRYAEWDRLADRFGIVSFAWPFIRDIAEYVPDEDLRKWIQKYGNWVRELSMFWFKKADFESFLSTVKLLNKYTRVTECEIHSQGRNYTMNFHHQNSRKLSVVLSTLLEVAMADFGIRPSFEVGDNYLSVSFTYNPMTDLLSSH